MQALLDMLNYNKTLSGPLDAIAIGKVRAGAMLSDRSVEELLVRLIQDGNSARKDGTKWRDAIRGQMLCVPTFDHGNFTEGRRYRTVILNGKAAQAYVLLLLLEPGSRYSERLRQCELPTCRNFFLFDPAAPALPRRYCCKEHSENGERLKTRERVRKHRQEPKARTNARRHK